MEKTKMLKDWRPISLLNVNFKILAQCLANRLKACMEIIQIKLKE